MRTKARNLLFSKIVPKGSENDFNDLHLTNRLHFVMNFAVRNSTQPEEGTLLVFSKECKSRIFQVTEYGALQHISSGLCVQPERQPMEPQNDERVVLRKRCTEEGSKFFMYAGGGKERSYNPESGQ